MKIVISIISSILSGMGIGGGSLFVILSTTFLNYDQKYAQALNLILFIAVSVSASVENIKDKKIDFKIFKKIFIPLTLGVLIGTTIVTKIKSDNLRKYFLYFLVAIGIYEIITSLIRIKKAKNNNK